MGAGRRLAQALLVVGLAACIVGDARAQGTPWDSCGGPVRLDTLTDSLFAWIPVAPGRARDALADFQEVQVRAVLGVLSPMPLLLRHDRQPLRHPVPPIGAAELTDAAVLVWFQVRGDGRLAGLHLEHASGWDTLDLGLQRAVLRADSLGILPPIPHPLAGRAVDLWLAVGVGRREGAVNLPVARARRVVRAGEIPPRLLGIAYRPQFPVEALRAGIGEQLVMEFVVDTTGYVIPESIDLVRATFREFAEEAVRAIRSTHWEPGHVGRCALRMWVRQPIGFTITN